MNNNNNNNNKNLFLYNNNLRQSEDLPNTVLISESNSSISSNKDESDKKINNIRFVFYDNNHIDYDIDSIKTISPNFFNNIMKKYNNNNKKNTPKKKKKIEILVPNNIPKNSFFDFLFLIKNGYNEIEEYTTEKLIKLLMLSDFFQNEKININLINDLIINKINSQNSFDFLVYSYNKLNNCNNSINMEYENVYFELFYKCLDKIGQDENIVIKNLNKLKSIDKKLSIEIVQKTFSHLIFSNYVYSKNNNNENFNNNNILNTENNDKNYFQTTMNLNNNNNNNKNNFDIDFSNHILKTEENPIHKIILNQKNSISESSLNNLIKSLFDIYNTKNFFDLLTLEYMKIFSSENLNELEQQPNPNFQIRISIYEYENYYEEYPIDIVINNKSVFFVLFYKISDDSFNVCIKLSEKKNINYNNKNSENNNLNEDNFCFKIFSFLTIVNIPNQSNDFSLLNQSSLKNLCNNKSMHTIFKLTNFSHFIKTNFYNNNNKYNLISNEEDSFLLQIRIKLCQIYTVLTNYLLKNFSNFYYNENFYKISKQLLLIILKHKNLSKKNENEIVLAIINWINNEINIKEDITELFDFINWNEVDDNLIFELIIRYNNFIVGNDYIENMFRNIFVKKFINNNTNINENNFNYLVSMIKNLFLAAKKIDFSNVFVNMKKNEKFNVLYKNNNNNSSSYININSNNNLNISNNNNKSSYKKNPLHIHQLNLDNSFHLNNNNNSNNNYNNINNSININNNSFILNNNGNNKNNFEKTFNNLSNNLKGESFNFLNNLTYNNINNSNHNINFYDNNNNKNQIKNLKNKSFSNKNIFKNNLNNNHSNSKKNNNKNNENSFTKINKYIINNNNNNSNSNKIITNFSTNPNEKSQIINLLIKKNIEPITFKNTLNLNSNKNILHKKILSHNNNNNNSFIINKKNDSLIKIKNNSNNKNKNNNSHSKKKIFHTRNKSNFIYQNNNSKLTTNSKISETQQKTIKIEEENKKVSNLMKNKIKNKKNNNNNNNLIINKSFNTINNNKNHINNN